MIAVKARKPAVAKNEVAEMKNEQEKLEDFLKSELMKEGDEILAEIEADESLKDISLPEEMDEGLWKKIQKRQAEKAAYEALSEKDKEALRLGREMMMLNVDEYGKDEGEDEKKTLVECDAVDDEESGVENDSVKVVKYSKKRKKRVYLLVAAVAVLALAAGMTSIGGAPFVAKIRKQLIGEREMVKVNSEREGEEDRVIMEGEEGKIWQEIKDQLGIEPVRLGYLPDGMKFIDCEIDADVEEACLLYECKGTVVEYQIISNYRDKSIGYDIEDNLIDEKELNIKGNNIVLRYYNIDNTNEEECVAFFKYNNVQYVLRTRIGYEVEKILENLIF
ncbi:MAG: DUF4367 domain-containing protein [Bariatricus sp.]